jgi:hypothetical protein
MINEPITIVHDGFQQAWSEVVELLMVSRWELNNLMVQIKDPSLYRADLDADMDRFARAQGLLLPKHVAYTIFPHGIYKRGRDAKAVFDSYNRANGLYERMPRRKRPWGTYFRRMTHYVTSRGVVNQLDNIITAIRKRRTVSRAAYTIVIQQPGGETIRPLGGPCLNYLAVQGEPGPPARLGLLAVYRNHDFLERAYGNYWGLCNLVRFLAKEAGGTPGPLTCVSSHAYVSGKKAALKSFVRGKP